MRDGASKHHTKAAKPDDVEVDADTDEDATSGYADVERDIALRHRAADDEEKAKPDKTAAAEDVDAEEDEAEPEAHITVRAPHAKSWHVAIGPNVWAASVDAHVAVGTQSIGTAIDFMQLSRNTRYGIPLLAEARYKDFSLMADFLYGVVDVTGQNQIGPVMVALQGNVSSLLVDGLAGYRVYGTDTSRIAAEARAGVRYQRTAISGSVGLADNSFSPPEIIDSGYDVLAGARVTVRARPWAFVTGTVDQSFAGSSTSTWSAGADANVVIKDRLQLTLGWRTLTQQRDAISTVMHGPRVAFQLLF